MPKRPVPVLEGGGVRLRPLQETDLPLTMAWRNRDDIRKWFLDSSPLTPERHQAWYEQYAGRDDDYVFLIEEALTPGRPVGQVALYHIDWQAGCAEFGRLMIGERAALGRGLAHAATELLVNYALDGLGLSEVHLQVLADNAPALAIYKACGFQPVDSSTKAVLMIKRKKRM